MAGQALSRVMFAGELKGYVTMFYEERARGNGRKRSSDFLERFLFLLVSNQG